MTGVVLLLPKICVKCIDSLFPDELHVIRDVAQRPVLAALAGWLAVMYGIQHAMIQALEKERVKFFFCQVPFLTGNQYEYFPIVATFIATRPRLVVHEDPRLATE